MVGGEKTYSCDGEPKLIEVQVVHQTTCQTENYERNQELESSDDNHPEWRLEHMAR